MKKVVAFLLAILCLTSMVSVAISADENEYVDPVEEKLKEALDPLDASSLGYSVDYMVMLASEHFRKGYEEHTRIRISEADYEGFLRARFFIDDETMVKIRNYYDGSNHQYGKHYDEMSHSYTIWEFRELPDTDPTRSYSHYIKLYDNIYEVYYTEMIDKYRSVKYTVRFENDIVCVISCEDYEGDPLNNLFQSYVGPFDNMGYETVEEYLLVYANYHFLDGNPEEEFVTVSAADYEAYLHALFFLNDEMLYNIRHYFDDVDDVTFYDEAAGTYTVWAFGGMGTCEPAREYSHYVKDGDLYHVYYSEITYIYLHELLPEGVTLDEFLADLGYKDERDYHKGVEYLGILFQYSPMEGFFAVSPDPTYHGIKYTVELNGSIVRILSYEPYDHELDHKFQMTLDLIDGYYGYDEYYMIIAANDYFLEMHEWEDFIEVPASEYEAYLNKYFYVDDAILYKIRHAFDQDHVKFYDETTQTYTLWSFGGLGIDGITPRQYSNYVQNEDNTYSVYYSAVTYGFLSDALPEEMDEYTYLESLGYEDFMDGPYSLEYDGVIYNWDLGGYYTVVSYDNNYGKKYTVEFNGDIVRIISCEDYKIEEPEETTPITPPVTEPESSSDTAGSVTAPESTHTPSAETHFVTLPLESGDYDTARVTGAPTKVNGGCGNVIESGFAIIAILSVGGIMIAKKKD